MNRAQGPRDRRHRRARRGGESAPRACTRRRDPVTQSPASRRAAARRRSRCELGERCNVRGGEPLRQGLRSRRWCRRRRPPWRARHPSSTTAGITKDGAVHAHEGRRLGHTVIAVNLTAAFRSLARRREGHDAPSLRAHRTTFRRSWAPPATRGRANYAASKAGLVACRRRWPPRSRAGGIHGESRIRALPRPPGFASKCPDDGRLNTSNAPRLPRKASAGRLATARERARSGAYSPHREAAVSLRATRCTSKRWPP